MSSPILIDETEAAFQARVVEYAVAHGWDWMHIGRVGKYAANGAKGTLGTGWPDLVLIRGGQLIFAELKANGKMVSTEQKRVIQILQDVGDVWIWRPIDWPTILEVLT